MEVSLESRKSNTTERLCQGPRLGLLVQKTDQQHSWPVSRVQLPSPFQAPCPHHHSSHLLSQFCRRCNCLGVLGKGAGAARSLHQKLTALSVCAFSSSLLSCLFPVCQHQPPPSPNLAYDHRCPRLWSWGGVAERCSSRWQRRNHEENGEQIIKKQTSLREGYMVAGSYTKSITPVVIRAPPEPVLIGFRELRIRSGINIKY